MSSFWNTQASLSCINLHVTFKCNETLHQLTFNKSIGPLFTCIMCIFPPMDIGYIFALNSIPNKVAGEYMTSISHLYGMHWHFIFSFFFGIVSLSLNIFLFPHSCFPIIYCVPNLAVAGSFSLNLPVTYWSGCAKPWLVQREAPIYYRQSTATLGLY